MYEDGLENSEALIRGCFDVDSNIFDIFENEMRNYKLEMLANSIKYQTCRPKQRLFFY